MDTGLICVGVFGRLCVPEQFHLRTQVHRMQGQPDLQSNKTATGDKICRRYTHFRWLQQQLTTDLPAIAKPYFRRHPLPDPAAKPPASLSAKALRGKLKAAGLVATGRREELVERWKQHVWPPFQGSISIFETRQSEEMKLRNPCPAADCTELCCALQNFLQFIIKEQGFAGSVALRTFLSGTESAMAAEVVGAARCASCVHQALEHDAVEKLKKQAPAAGPKPTAAVKHSLPLKCSSCAQLLPPSSFPRRGRSRAGQRAVRCTPCNDSETAQARRRKAAINVDTHRRIAFLDQVICRRISQTLAFRERETENITGQNFV